MVNKLFESDKHPQSESFLSNNFQCLFHFGACLPFAKKINHLVYDVDHIVEDVVMINDSVNCLFAVCKLSIWILLRLFTGWMMLLIGCWRCFTKILSLLRLFAIDWWCLQSEKVAEIVRCDLSIAKKLFECLLTMIWIFYECDKRC